jgi:Sap, sulfolipid-1-addressing protein
MLLQAAGFAVLAALSPTALLITAIYLGSARPRTTALCYLAGALLISTVMGVAVLLLLRYGHFQLPGHRTPRYGLRLGLGLLILAAIAVVARRSHACWGSRSGRATPGRRASRRILASLGSRASRDRGRGSCRGWCPAPRR